MGGWPVPLPDPSPPRPAPLRPPYRLQQVQIPLEEEKACEEGYGKYLRAGADGKVIPEDMLCAGTLGRGPCYVRRSAQPQLRVSPWPSVLGH